VQGQEPVLQYYRLMHRYFEEEYDTSNRMKSAPPGEAMGMTIHAVRRLHQLRTRLLFLRLFKLKFGFGYDKFLTDHERRKEVYQFAPEFPGPMGRSEDHRAIQAKVKALVRGMDDKGPDDFEGVFKAVHPPDGRNLEPVEWRFPPTTHPAPESAQDLPGWVLREADLFPAFEAMEHDRPDSA